MMSIIRREDKYAVPLTAKNKAWKRTHLDEERGSKDGGGSVAAVPNLHPMSVQTATTVEPPSQRTTLSALALALVG